MALMGHTGGDGGTKTRQLDPETVLRSGVAECSNSGGGITSRLQSAHRRVK